jgi:hypothetical protein
MIFKLMDGSIKPSADSKRLRTRFKVAQSSLRPPGGQATGGRIFAIFKAATLIANCCNHEAWGNGSGRKLQVAAAVERKKECRD